MVEEVLLGHFPCCTTSVVVSIYLSEVIAFATPRKRKENRENRIIIGHCVFLLADACGIGGIDKGMCGEEDP